MAITINGTTGLSGVDGSAGTPALQGSDPNTGIYSPGADQVAVATNGTGRLFVNASGNVGVGTTSDGARLHVLTGTSGKSWTPVTGTSALFERNSINYVTIAAANNNTSQLNFADTDDADIGNIKYNHAENSLSFGVNNSERLRIDSSGRLLVGSSSSSANTQVESSNTGGNNYGAYRFVNSGGGSDYWLFKSRGTTVGAHGLVSNGDISGTIQFALSDGANYVRCASISAVVDNTPGTNDMPGRLVFSTTADGASSPTERMRIDRSGALTLSDNATIDPIGSSKVGGFAAGNDASS